MKFLAIETKYISKLSSFCMFSQNLQAISRIQRRHGAESVSALRYFFFKNTSIFQSIFYKDFKSNNNFF